MPQSDSSGYMPPHPHNCWREMRPPNVLRTVSWLLLGWVGLLLFLVLWLSGCSPEDRQRIRDAATGSGAKDTATAVCALAHGWDGKTPEVDPVRTVCPKRESVEPWLELSRQAAALVEAQRAGKVRPDSESP